MLNGLRLLQSSSVSSTILIFSELTEDRALDPLLPEVEAEVEGVGVGVLTSLRYISKAASNNKLITIAAPRQKSHFLFVPYHAAGYQYFYSVNSNEVPTVCLCSLCFPAPTSGSSSSDDVSVSSSAIKSLQESPEFVLAPLSHGCVDRR